MEIFVIHLYEITSNFVFPYFETSFITAAFNKCTARSLSFPNTIDNLVVF